MGVEVFHLHPCPGVPCPLTLRAPFSALLPSSGPHSDPPTPGRQQAGGMGGRGALGGTEAWCLEGAGGCERLLRAPGSQDTPSHLWLW